MKKILLFLLTYSTCTLASPFYCGADQSHPVRVGDTFKQVTEICGTPMTILPTHLVSHGLPVKRWKYTDVNFKTTHIDFIGGKVVRITQAGVTKSTTRCGYRAKIRVGDTERNVIDGCGYPHHEKLLDSVKLNKNKATKIIVYKANHPNMRWLLSFENNHLIALKHESISNEDVYL